MTGPVDAVESPQQDPLELATSVLESIDNVPLERHPELFTRFDQLLRDALDAAAPTSPG